MNVLELLADLQAQHEKATARAGELRDQIDHLTAASAVIEARPTDLATTRQVIAELAPTQEDSEAPETTSIYQAIVNAFNQHPAQELRSRELHELLGMNMRHSCVKKSPWPGAADARTAAEAPETAAQARPPRPPVATPGTRSSN
ncbi:hypothetical protein ACFY1U_43970 [Streptomyces sp. NPDC001351]|uniref:hypothetical protein n=1 Tax=Streptomyces sp. NPDC001351 TaxID=3364564 RepID=UPI0036B264C1